MPVVRVSHFRFLAIIISFVTITAASSALAQASSDSLVSEHGLKDAYGVRLGTIGNYFAHKNVQIPNSYDGPPAMGGWRPALDPYYEAPLAQGLTASYDLMLVYKSFGVFGFSDFSFQSYGFNCQLRWDPSVSCGDATSNQRMHPYYAFGAGFDTFTDRVSLSLPLSAGELIPLAGRAQLELAARVTPQLFLGNGPGMYYGITAGIRIINPR